jgi:hypothetical protein
MSGFREMKLNPGACRWRTGLRITNNGFSRVQEVFRETVSGTDTVLVQMLLDEEEKRRNNLIKRNAATGLSAPPVPFRREREEQQKV